VFDFNGRLVEDPGNTLGIDPLNPNIDFEAYDKDGDGEPDNPDRDPPLNAIDGIDNVEVHVKLSEVFKKNSAPGTLPLTIGVRRVTFDSVDDDYDAPPTGWWLEWENPLYLCELEPNLRILTTDHSLCLDAPLNPNPDHDSHALLYFDPDVNADASTDVQLIGIYDMPLFWVLEQTAL
jgi:hypothetical protein